MRSSASPVLPPRASPEDGHDAEAEDDEAGPERPHVDQLGAGDQEAADGEQGEWDSDAPGADERIEGGVDPVARIAPVPAEPERNGEEDARGRRVRARKARDAAAPGRPSTASASSCARGTGTSGVDAWDASSAP